jgi:ubiquinone/menaquinone biosynthesis C-methylase UbiE
MSAVAAQLRRPSGRVAGLVAWLLNRVNAPMNARTLELLEVATDDRVLEVGFGGGALLASMASVATRGLVVGVDFSPEVVERARRQLRGPVADGRVELRCADAAALPYPDESFSRACTVNTIYFWPDPQAVLAELRRVIAPDGRLVVTFGAKETAEKLPYTRHGFRLYEAAEVQALLEGAGFRAVRIESGGVGRFVFLCAVAVR